MTPQLSLDDHRTLQAIGILADALDDVSGAGVIDTVLVSKALRQVLATRSRPAFDFASRAFSTLDPEVKRQVAADADNKAREHASGLRTQDKDLPPPAPRSAASPPPPPPPSKAAPRSATSVLAALNSRGRGAPPPRRGGGGEGQGGGGA